MTRRLAHAINTLCVVLPLYNMYSIAKSKKLLLKASVVSTLANNYTVMNDGKELTSSQQPPSLAYVVILILILAAVSQLVAVLLEWSRVQHYYDSKDSLKSLHHFIRDSGIFPTLMNFMSLQHVVPILLKYPGALWWKFQLYRHHRHVIRYGHQSSSQHVDLYLPSTDQDQDNDQHVEGLIIFVHGGAWGSGSPAQYSIVAKPFLTINWAVAIVGYRLYPEGDASTQIVDLELAISELARSYPHLFHNNNHVCLVGHSSGAHLCMLAMVERARRELELSRTLSKHDLMVWKRNHQVPLNYMIGLSGPYNILNHYEFETQRGVEQISPMSPANGHSNNMFLRFSPAVQFRNLVCQCRSEEERHVLQKAFPPTTLIHGMNDETVPSSSTKVAAQLINSTGVAVCKEIYVDDLGHEETIVQVMFGGPVQDILTNLLQQQ